MLNSFGADWSDLITVEMHGTCVYIYHLFLKVSYGMDKRRHACCLDHPKKNPTKSGNITTSANAVAILTPTNHVAIRCLLVTCPFKKTELFL